MKWTEDQPTKDGWYWHRGNDGIPKIARVIGTMARIAETSFTVGTFPGEWAGPLSVPDEPAKRHFHLSMLTLSQISKKLRELVDHLELLKSSGVVPVAELVDLIARAKERQENNLATLEMEELVEKYRARG